MATILVVDDDPVVRFAVDSALRKAGYKVESAEDGYSALERLRFMVFDLIISDANMPGGLSGFNLVATIKKESRLKNIPVMFLTGRREKNDIIRAHKSGAVDYLIKPVNYALLLKKVEALLKTKVPKKTA